MERPEKKRQVVSCLCCVSPLCPCDGRKEAERKKKKAV